MTFRSFAAARRFAVIIVLLSGARVSAATPCPTQSGDAGFDALAKDLAAQPDCKSAVARFADCAWGSSADTQFSPIVIKTCEAAFFDRLSPTAQLNYAKRMQMCAYEYAHQQGTLYMSMAARCQADLAGAVAADPSLANKPVKASFDCGAAKTALEKAICSDDTLGQADMILAETYKGGLKASDAKARADVVASQRRWLTGLSAACHLGERAPATKAAIACLTSAFEARFTTFDSCLENELTAACLDAKDEDALQQAPRASFDCQTPKTPLEIVICADADLGKHDIELAEAYRAADAKLGPASHAGLVASERKWLRFVASTCPLGAIGGIPSVWARGCVRSAFGVRTSQLETCAAKSEADRMPCLDQFEIVPKKK